MAQKATRLSTKPIMHEVGVPPKPARAHTQDPGISEVTSTTLDSNLERRTAHCGFENIRWRSWMQLDITRMFKEVIEHGAEQSTTRDEYTMINVTFNDN